MNSISPSAFSLKINDHRVAILTFDLPGATANVFNKATLTELDIRLQQIDSSEDLAGLVIRSGKPSIFIAGADLKALANIHPNELAKLLALGQDVFNRLASLTIPTVAAINGACVGGGCELALACDWRVATDSRTTRLGLPETQLGILPAWGGTTRLPRLLGLPAALGLILTGRLLRPAAALHQGLVDAVVPAESLLDGAHQYITRGKRRLSRHPVLHSFPSVAVIRHQARAKLRAKTRGHYPAPFKALDVACRSVSTTACLSLRNEREAAIDLATLPSTKNLMRLFFLTEHARKLRVSDTKTTAVRNTAVVGAGVMGAGIAYWLSSRGLQVTVQDINAESIATGMARIESLYKAAVRRRVMTRIEADRGLDRIVPATGPIPLRRMDLVIEAATEDLDIKRKIFAELAGRTSPTTILATNTSALPLHKLASGIPHPGRLVGLHFFNPVQHMKLIEVVQADTTSPNTLATAVRFVQQIEKLPVVVADRPGFLVNRILMPYLLQAGLLFENGGEPVTIDSAMLEFGMPMGPLRLLDEVGLDVALSVANTLRAAFEDRFPAPSLLENMTREGLFGKKTGAGFYLYDNKGPRPNPAALALRGPCTALPDDLGFQLAAIMVDEAKRCLDERVADLSDDIDLAMILGTGFAPFRGGPLRYGRDAGLLHPRRTPRESLSDIGDYESTPIIL